MVSAAAAASASSPTLARALAAVQQTQKRPRSEKKPIPTEQKDTKYFERRKRNNMAAKKSRDARKAREDEIAIRASFLEKENAILRAQVGTLREEANSLKQLLLQKRSRPWSLWQIHHVKPVLYVLYIYPFFDLLSVYVYIAIKVELLYYIYIITIVKKRILQLQLSLKNFFFFQSRCQCVLLTHFRYVAFAVLWKNKSRCNFHWYGIPSKFCTIDDDFLWESYIVYISDVTVWLVM